MQEEMLSSPPLPVTILTGFLGAGKTTLINYLLAHHGDQPLAILENEFGAVNIDGGLLNRGDNVSVVELSNGCVCCSVRGEFTEALTELLDRRLRGELNFERLIVETTGLADPAPIIQTFFVDDRLRGELMLDAVITLVDAEHILKQLDEHRVAASQIGFADRILLTKADRVGTQEKERVLQRIGQINNKADVFEIIQGVCPASLWLDIRAFELSDDVSVREGFHIVSASPAQPVRFQPFRAQEEAGQSWNDDIRAHVFEAGYLDLKRIGAFMEQTIERYGNDMLRYKGVLAIDDQPQRLIVQGVHKVVGFDYGSAWGAEEAVVSRLVIIGRQLPAEALQQAFMQTQAGSPSAS
ncbi:CobW family GTP-binding protein [Enterobacillus tribolii]|uniref:G3E family GTPase n=1 Tax=Enterobacillus tribolii TaxID=1487935 RepID=A0A370QHE5_9GAMM|nr:GTP-binding protein [Enterobacillus tribolii]RDK87776.1 G3E family GTPase [Enterobacillus tribolii]